MTSSLRNILGVLCIGVITVCSVLIVQKMVGRARVDLTQHNVYTLSEGTLNIIEKINQPIELNLYYSRTAAMKGPEGIRYYNNYYQYVRDLLTEYASRSKGRLTLNIIDPRPYSDQEEEAIGYQIRRFSISPEEGFFFGLAAITELGKHKTIEFFEPERQEFVEYDISQMLTNVMTRDKKKIGVISSLEVMGSDQSPYMMQMLQMQGRQPQRPWTIIEALREQYEVVAVDSVAEEIESDIDFLLLVHPKALSEKTLFAIDQYVMGGGRLIAFVDPHCLNDQPPQNPQNPYAAMQEPRASDLNALLKGWGVEMDTGEIAADREFGIRAQTQPNVPAQLIPTVLRLNEQAVNPAEPITGKLHSMRMAYAGVLKPVEGAESTVTSLLTTSEVGTTWRPASPFELAMPDPANITRAIIDGEKPLMLGARISGKLVTNFPEGLASDDEASDAEGEHEEGGKEADDDKADVLTEANEDAMVVVFTDVDMLSDMMCYEQTFFGMAQVGNNASLLFNSVDYLAGDSDLIAIRERGRFERPFKVVDEIEKEAERATAEQVAQVNARISEFESKLNELGGGASLEEAQLIAGKAMAERSALETQIRSARKELKLLNARKLESKEQLKRRLQALNMVVAPAIILLIAIALAALRAAKAKRYAARRAN